MATDEEKRIIDEVNENLAGKSKSLICSKCNEWSAFCSCNTKRSNLIKLMIIADSSYAFKEDNETIEQYQTKQTQYFEDLARILTK